MCTLDLVNGKIVYFSGFADSAEKEPKGQVLSQPPAFMLIKVPGKTFKIGQFSPGVFPLPTSSLTFRRRKRKATFNQFPVTLAYAITDYKCQGETYYDGLLTDLPSHSPDLRRRHRCTFNLAESSLSSNCQS
jgi:hypothetical protein